MTRLFYSSRVMLFAFIVVVSAAMLVQAFRLLRGKKSWHLGDSALMIWGSINILWVLYLCVNHVAFPLNLDLMEGTILQHFRQAAAFTAVYPPPSPEFVALAYNPLFYFIAVPFSWIFGVNLLTLRLVAIVAMIGIGVLLYLVVREQTRSPWWALIGVGLYAAAYRVMDAYLDTAHSDSWFIFSALLGAYIISRNRSRAWNAAAIVVLVASFWFKQHGAVFAVGGLLYLTMREGIKGSIRYWIIAIVLGPVLYLLGTPLFGPYFHYFTWVVPSQWSQLNLGTFDRYFGFLFSCYAPLFALSLWTAAEPLLNRRRPDIWRFMLPFALLTGFMGSLDRDSSNNVYIAEGVWIILLGTLALGELAARRSRLQQYQPQLVLLAASFAFMIYTPASVVTSPRADKSYADLVAYLVGLHGPVYTPGIGQLPSGFTAYPSAHWVALEDMVRGPGRDTRNQPTTRSLLQPLLAGEGHSFILTNRPLEKDRVLDFLLERYAPVADLGDRFEPLRALPKRWDHGWPRYLYGVKVDVAVR